MLESINSRTKKLHKISSYESRNTVTFKLFIMEIVEVVSVTVFITSSI